MNKIFLLIVVFSLSCKDDTVHYYNHEDWKWTTDVMGWWFYEHVYGKPVEVKEIFYNEIHNPNDTLFELPAYQIRRFNRDGNLTSLKTVYNDSTCFIEIFHYDQNGQQNKEYVINKNWRWGFNEKDTARRKSILLPNGKYKVAYYDASSISPDTHYSLLTFSNNNRTIIEDELLRESINDTVGNIITLKAFSNKLRVYSTEIKDFDKNGDLIKYEYDNHRNTGFFYKFFYSKKHFLDSIQIYDDGKWKSTDYYLNNEHGDPIKIGDTTFTYQYDKKKNWVQRNLKCKVGSINVVREIKYAQ